VSGLFDEPDEPSDKAQPASARGAGLSESALERQRDELERWKGNAQLWAVQLSEERLKNARLWALVKRARQRRAS
jgi:hypothetical protein